MKSLWNQAKVKFGIQAEKPSILIDPADDLDIDCGQYKTIWLTSPVWDDLPSANLDFRATGGTTPALVQLPGGRNAQARTFDLSDLSYIQTEVTHKFKEGSALEIHIHWMNQGSDATDPKYVNFEVPLSVAKLDVEIGVEVPHTTGNVEIPANAGNIHRVSSCTTTVAAADIEIGAYILGMFRRIANTDGAANPAQHPYVFAVGFHGIIDTLGSRQMYIK